MEALTKRYGLLFAALIMSFGSMQAQEVDDMYFTKKDREKLNEQKVSINKKMPSAQNEVAAEHVYNNENAYSEEHVNPEYLARYGNQTDTPAGQEEYFTDQTTTGNISQPPVINNYYTTPRPYFAPSFNMGYSPWGWNYGIGMTFGYGYGSFMPRYGWGGFYDPWMDPWMNPWGPRWSMSMSFGYGWGSPFYYDPFYRRNPWAWGGWGAGAWGYCPPGYGGNVVIINNYESRYNRTFRPGSGPSRSNVDRLASRSGTSNTNEGTGFSGRTGDFNGKAVTPSRVASAVPTRKNNSNSSRGISQSDYYRRSQSSRTISDDIVSRATRSRSQFSSPNSNYSTRSREAGSSTRTISGMTPTTTSSRVTSGNRPMSTSTYSPRSSSNTGRSYNGYAAPARSTGSRYGTPSRGNNSSPSYNRSYSPSRTNSSYMGTSPSRSNGSYRGSSPSRSSGSYSAPSRSSGSSGSRSSGASRSSGSRSSSSGVRRSN